MFGLFSKKLWKTVAAVGTTGANASVEKPSSDICTRVLSKMIKLFRSTVVLTFGSAAQSGLCPSFQLPLKPPKLVFIFHQNGTHTQKTKKKISRVASFTKSAKSAQEMHISNPSELRSPAGQENLNIPPLEEFSKENKWRVFKTSSIFMLRRTSQVNVPAENNHCKVSA